MISARIHQMDWASRTESRGNASKTADSFFHPSGPSEFDYLIQRKSLILQSNLAPGADRTPFHPVNPGINNVLQKRLYNYPLDLVERHFIIPPIIQLGRPRAFMVRHLLRVLEKTAIFQVDRDRRP